MNTDDNNKKRRWWRAAGKPVAWIMGLVLFITWAGGFLNKRVGSKPVEHQPGFALPEDAKSFTVKMSPVAPLIDVVGTAESAEKIHLSARINAYVIDVRATAGSRVKKGEILIRLDDREIREQLTAREAELKHAETEYRRTRQLHEQDATTEQALTTAESNLQSAQAEVDRAKVMLTYAEISSPIDGLVADRQVESGDLANPGQVLMTVHDPVNMRLEVPVPVRLVEKFQLGQTVNVELDRPQGTINGTVSEIVGEIDPQSRTQKVKILLENPDQAILPGSFGRVWVQSDARPTVLAPRSAVYPVGQLELVQVLQDGRVIRRAVTTGPLHGDQIEILSGLKPEEQILVEPVKEH